MAQAQISEKSAVTIENEEEEEFGPQAIKKLEVSARRLCCEIISTQID